MRDCPGGCGTRIATNMRLCADCLEEENKRLRTPFPEDPEFEQKTKLYNRFREMLFSEKEARDLADEWADPLEVAWSMEKHEMSHIRAAQIFGKGKPSREVEDEEAESGGAPGAGSGTQSGAASG